MTANYIRKQFDEFSSSRGGVVKFVRRDMGLSAFGVQIFDWPPGATGPEHDESSTGQEELYIGLEGSGVICVDGTDVDISPRVAVAIPSGVIRQTVAGPEGLSYICVGATPGRPYEIPEFFR